MAAVGHKIEMQVCVTQPGLNIETSADLTPSQEQLITFGQYFKGDKGDKGDDGVGIPQELSINGNDLSISGGNTVKLPTGVTFLSELSDVDLDSLANGQALVYNSTTQKWENQDIPSDAFICTFTQTTEPQTEESVISCDKTIAEIIAAANDGKTVLGKVSGETETGFIPLNLIYNNIVIFGGLMSTPFGNALTILFGVNNSPTDSDEWGNETNSFASVAFSGDYNALSNLPTLGTAAALDVAASGNASSTQVVKGDDTRLTDPRPASDVSAWAKAATKPSYTASEVGAIPTTEKGANGGVAELDSNGKVPSSQLPSYVDDVVNGYLYNGVFYKDSTHTSTITPEDDKIYIELTTNKTYRWSGSAYFEISESLALGETSSTAYAGNKGKANADAIDAIKDGTSIDSFGDVETALADKINKSSTAGLVKNDGTIDTNTYLTQHQDISGKADKVSNPTNGNFAALDSSGNLTDSGHKHSDYLTSHQDISGKANKSEMSVVDGTGSAADKTTITLKTGTSATVLKSHQDISGKQNVINSSNKLSADYIVDGTTNKVINVKPDWNAAAGNAAEILNKPTIPDAVSGTDDGTNWTSLTIGSVTKNIPSAGGLTNYDFTHTANQAVSGSVTVTYAADTRGSKMVTTSADLSVTFAVNNSSDNYLWIKNTGSSDIDIAINSVTHNSTSVSNVYVPDDGITVPAGKVCEIGIVCNADGAFITSRSDLSL